MNLSKKIFIFIFTLAVLAILFVIYFVYLVTGSSYETLQIALVVTPLLVVVFSSLFFLIRSTLAPIPEISKAIDAFKKGNKNYHFPQVSNDDIGQLATSVNDIITELNTQRANFGNIVSEKIVQLAAKVEEAQRERRRDNAILSSIGEGLIAVDETGKILMINEFACYLLSLNSSKVIGRPTREVFEIFDLDGNPIKGEDRSVEIALSSHVKTVREVIFRPTDQKKLILTMTATPIVDNDKIIGAIEVIRDTTKEKEVDRMKTEFISLASHQLRTPLSAIRWFTEMLLNGDAGILNSEQSDYTKNISDSTERMIQLVNSLLNISRIESGRILIDPKPTDLRELVQGVVTDLKAKIEEKQQNLIISVHEGLPKINIDPRLIRQVYLNLLTNAIKYTPKGGEITVFISSKGDEVVSQVTDNGYGIPKNAQDKVFQKFFRAENVAKVETDGTGLGLYLIKAVVESSKGKIWFASEEGKGTTFWFTIPLSGTPAKQGEVTLD